MEVNPRRHDERCNHHTEGKLARVNHADAQHECDEFVSFCIPRQVLVQQDRPHLIRHVLVDEEMVLVTSVDARPDIRPTHRITDGCHHRTTLRFREDIRDPVDALHRGRRILNVDRSGAHGLDQGLDLVRRRLRERFGGEAHHVPLTP